MSSSTPLSNVASAQVCQPGGPCVYGRVSSYIAEALGRGEKPPGIRVWYRCNSCRRTIRIEEELKHNEEFHWVAKCGKCDTEMDKFQLRDHEKTTCPKLKTFCKFCYATLTLGEVQSHLDSCSEGNKIKTEKSTEDAMLVLKNFEMNTPMAQDLMKIAQSRINQGNETQFNLKELEKYKGPFGYRLFPIDDQEKKEGLSENAAIKKKHILCKYLTKKLITPQAKIQRQIQTHCLKLEAEAKLAQAATLDSTQKSKQQGVYSKKTYVRTVHDFTASCCRQDARRHSDRSRRQNIVTNLIKLNRWQETKAKKEQIKGHLTSDL